MRLSGTGCPQVLWVRLGMLPSVVVVWQGFAGMRIGVVILWAMPAARAARLKPGAPMGLRPAGSASLSQRPLQRQGPLPMQHSCCAASGLHQCQTTTAGQAQSARPRSQGMLAAQALRTEMRPAGRAWNTAGLRAPPLARCAAVLLGSGVCARPWLTPKVDALPGMEPPDFQASQGLFVLQASRQPR